MNVKKILVVGLLMGSAAVLKAETGEALIQSTTDTSKTSGLVKFEDTKAGLKITTRIENAPAGQHGFHIHEFGSCGEGGNKAGSHYNPKGNPHGMVMKDGVSKVHPGDLGNVTIGTDGKGSMEAVVPGLTLSNSEFTVGGRAVVFHAKMDDFGQPTGNAGGRIGCGLVTITGK